MKPTRLADGERRSRLVLYVALLPVLFIIVGYVIYPLYKIFLESFLVNGVFSMESYQKFFDLTRRSNLESAWNSIYISVLSILTCGVVGIGMAFLLESFEFPGRRLMKVFAVVPMALPALIGANSFKFLYGESGIIPRALKELFNLPHVPFYLDGMAGILMVHTFTMYTYFYLPVSAALRNFDGSLEEAAYNLGASKLCAFRRVVLPMLTPSVVSASLLVFMISMASYTAPLIFGVDRTLTMQIYLSRTNGNLSMAATQSTILTAISVGFLLLMRWYESRRNYMNVSKGVSPIRREVKSRAAKICAIVGSIAAVIFLSLPILVIILISFSVDGSWTIQVIPDQFTLDYYINLFRDPKVWLPMKNSLIMSVLATGGNVIFGVMAAYLISRKNIRGKRLVDTLIMVPWALPGTVVGVSLIAAFNVPSLFSFGNVLVGTFWILPLAYFVRHLPLVYRSTHAAFEQSDPSAEDAARSLGATWVYSFRRVVLPMVFGGVASGAILGFVQGIGEFVASVLLFTNESMPLSVAINQKMYSFKFGTACAYGVLQIALVVVLLLLSEWLKGDGTPKKRRSKAA